MSGPKTSRYTLTPEQRRILEEQRRLERRIAVASEKIKRSAKNVLLLGGDFSEDCAVAEELCKRIGEDGGVRERVEEIKSLAVMIDGIKKKADKSNVELLEADARTAGDHLERARKLAHEIGEISLRNRTELKKGLESDIDKGFSTSFADLKLPKEKTFSEILSERSIPLEKMKMNTFLPKELLLSIEESLLRMRTFEEREFLENYYALNVTPLLKKCEDFISEYEKCKDEFESLYSEYVALCELYYYTAQEYVCSRESVKLLTNEIERIKSEVEEDDERDYIMKCLDEVMEEMGYPVIGSRDVVKKNGKRFHSELYSYRDGTAINVTCSSDGRIAIELGGVDDSDRLPSPEEVSALCRSMDSFCGDFCKIEQRLKEKGVVVSERISLLPPSSEYAQIINADDYETQVPVDRFSVPGKRKAIRKKKIERME